MSTTENTSTIASLHCAQAAAAQAAASWYRNFQTAQEGNQEAEVVRFSKFLFTYFLFTC
jgi:hypothetical protein